MPTRPNKYLFLFTRLPDYFFRCIQSLLNADHKGSEAIVVCYPPDKNATFNFPEVPGLKLVRKNDFKRETLDQWKPDLIYVAGWSDKDYAVVVQQWKSIVPVVMGMDNPWKGTIKQRIAVLLSPVLFRNKAPYIWVAGYPQYEFARRIGYPATHIIDGLYCADISRFLKKEEEKITGRKKILFVGRMVEYKRPHWLAETFSNICARYPQLSEQWELVLAGSGPLEESIRSKYGHLSIIKQIPFIQPQQLVQWYHQASVFCLPSDNEHWGVVVHEAAAAGLSLLLSDTCGAATSFLIHGYNGATFSSNNKASLEKNLLQLMQLPDEELQLQGKRSAQLADRINHQTWSGQLKSLLNEFA